MSDRLQFTVQQLCQLNNPTLSNPQCRDVQQSNFMGRRCSHLPLMAIVCRCNQMGPLITPAEHPVTRLACSSHESLIVCTYRANSLNHHICMNQRWLEYSESSVSQPVARVPLIRYDRLDVKPRRQILIALKNCVFWYVTPCGSCKNRRFGGT
jgi:hypothetical protein